MNNKTKKGNAVRTTANLKNDVSDKLYELCKPTEPLRPNTMKKSEFHELEMQMIRQEFENFDGCGHDMQLGIDGW